MLNLNFPALSIFLLLILFSLIRLYMCNCKYLEYLLLACDKMMGVVNCQKISRFDEENKLLDKNLGFRFRVNEYAKLIY